MDDPVSPDLLEVIYDAALEPSHWNDVIARVSRLAGGVGGQLLLWDDVTGAGFSSMLIGALSDPVQAERLFRERYADIDPRRAHAMTVPIGDWFTCHQICDERFVSRSEFYQDYFIPVTGGRYMAGARLADQSGLHAMLAIARPAQASVQPFDGASLQLLKRMTPHLSRAALSDRDAALDRLGLPLAVVERDGWLRFANREAEAALSAPGGPLGVRLGRVRAARPAEAARLERAIEAASTHRAGSSVALHGATAATVLYCTVVPVSPHALIVDPWQRPLAMLLLTDPARSLPVHHGMLRDLFGLTPAESRLAGALAEGLSPVECAERFAVALPTIRAQIRSIFLKVGVHRQTSLVALLQRLGVGSGDPHTG